MNNGLSGGLIPVDNNMKLPFSPEVNVPVAHCLPLYVNIAPESVTHFSQHVGWVYNSPAFPEFIAHAKAQPVISDQAEQQQLTPAVSVLTPGRFRVPIAAPGRTLPPILALRRTLAPVPAPRTTISVPLPPCHQPGPQTKDIAYSDSCMAMEKMFLANQ